MRRSSGGSVAVKRWDVIVAALMDSGSGNGWLVEVRGVPDVGGESVCRVVEEETESSLSD
jgi:hypothetical protein